MEKEKQRDPLSELPEVSFKFTYSRKPTEQSAEDLVRELEGGKKNEKEKKQINTKEVERYSRKGKENRYII